MSRPVAIRHRRRARHWAGLCGSAAGAGFDILVATLPNKRRMAHHQPHHTRPRNSLCSSDIADLASHTALRRCRHARLRPHRLPR